MHEPTEQDKNLLEELGYEQQDFSAGPVARSLVPFFGAVFVTFALAWGFFTLVAPEMTRRPPTSQLERRRVPAEGVPLLQTNVTAHQDMVDQIAEDRRKAEGYGWTDRKRGRVSIPVEQAMESVVREGLPSRPGARVPEGETPAAMMREAKG